MICNFILQDKQIDLKLTSGSTHWLEIDLKLTSGSTHWLASSIIQTEIFLMHSMSRLDPVPGVNSDLSGTGFDD